MNTLKEDTQENEEQQTDLDKLNDLLWSLYETIETEYSHIREFYNLVSSTNLTSTDIVRTSREIVDHSGKGHFANDYVEDYCEEIRVHLEQYHTDKGEL